MTTAAAMPPFDNQDAAMTMALNVTIAEINDEFPTDWDNIVDLLAKLTALENANKHDVVLEVFGE
eukprot:7271024-Pyramimonas_sp.AAC.1